MVRGLNPSGGKIIHTHPVWLWGPLSFLYDRYHAFLWVKWLGSGIDFKESIAIPLLPPGPL